MSNKKEPEFSLILIPAPDETPIQSAEYQVELKAFQQSLTAHGIKFSSHMTLMESAFGGGFHLGEFGIIAAASIVPLAGLLRAWLKARYGRKVKLKIKDFSAEAASVEEVDKLLKLAEKHREKRSHK